MKKSDFDAVVRTMSTEFQEEMALPQNPPFLPNYESIF